MPRIHRFITPARTLTCCLALALVCPALALADTVRFQIKAEPLSIALKEFAQQAHMQLLYEYGIVQDIMGNPVVGVIEKHAALEELLKNTGLEAIFSSENAATIKLLPTGVRGDAPKASGKNHDGRATAGTKLGLSVNGSTKVDDGEAAGGEPPKAAPALQEIIVTAQKRKQRLIDVPLALTVVTGQEIEARGVTNLNEMQYAAPGLTMAEYGAGGERIQLNGISQLEGDVGLPVVGIYMDEMPLTLKTPPDIQMFDMARVEILHGPQPTLYGDGAMGGTIRYVTASPDLKKFGGYADAQWGSVQDGASSYRAVAVLNAPLEPGELGLRLVAGYGRDGGWIDSLLTGKKDVNYQDYKIFRGKLLFRPFEALSLSLLAQHEEDSQPHANFGMPDRATALRYSPQGQTLDIGNLVITYDLGWSSLLSTTGFVNAVTGTNLDVTGYFLPLLQFFYPPEVASNVNAVSLSEPADGHMFTQEFRLSSKSTGRLNYIIGGEFRSYDYEYGTSIPTTPAVQPPLDNTTEVTKFQDWAIFAELRYALTDRLEVLAGLRHFQDRQNLANSGNGILVSSGILRSEATFISNNPRLNLSYKTSKDGLVYVNIAKGFRSGGFNPGIFGAPPTYGPETLWTYTLGVKQEWFEHRLSVDLSGYYNKWTNMQVTGIGSTGPLLYVGNSGTASGPGVDFALTARPIRALTFSVSIGYTNMRHDDQTAVNDAGDPVDLVSKWTASASTEYRRPLVNNMIMMSRIDWGYSGGWRITARNLNPAIYAISSRNVLNARIGIDVKRYQFYVYGANLTDNNGLLFPAPLGADPEPILQAPRTIGVGGRVSF